MPTGAKMIPYLRIENLKNHALSRGTYLYSPYMGVPSPGDKIERRREERGALLASKWIRALTSTPKLTWEVFIPFHYQKISNLNGKCLLIGIYNSECNVV